MVYSFPYYLKLFLSNEFVNLYFSLWFSDSDQITCVKFGVDVYHIHTYTIHVKNL